MNHRMGMRSLWSVLIFLCLGFVGMEECVAKSVDAEFRWQVGDGNWVDALKTARGRIEKSSWMDSKAVKADDRLRVIQALGGYVGAYGWRQEYDDEVQKYYREGLKEAEDSVGARLVFDMAMARYYMASDRPGLAIPYVQKRLEYWKSQNNPYGLMNAYQDLADTYARSGDLAGQQQYQQASLEIAKAYYQFGKQPGSAAEWVSYHEILLARMEDAANRRDARELAELWKEDEPVLGKYLAKRFYSYLTVAEDFSRAGDKDKAARLYDQAGVAWRNEFSPLSKQTDLSKLNLPPDDRAAFACTQATIWTYAGNVSAVKGFDECERLNALFKRELDAKLYRMRGLAYEKAEQFNKAVDAYQASIASAERTRKSFSLAERLAFFRTNVRESYGGLLRASVRRAAASGAEKDFDAALQASELMRGRQFGELLDEGAQAKVATQKLKMVREGLKPGEAVLAYSILDDAVVLVGFTKDRQLARVLPLDVKDLNHRLRVAARDLGDPGSDAGQIEAQLVPLSRTLLLPAGELLRGKTKLLVLPDESLNLIPFDLLTLTPDTYRPLIKDMTVRVAPSFRFLVLTAKRESVQGAKGVFALGDPAYGKGSQLADAKGLETAASTRGSDYLQYFAPLPETRTEVASIANLFPEGGQSVLLGGQATESAVKKANLKDFRYVHFATHGVLGGDVPGLLEPALVLGNEPGEDGFLTSSEVLSLKLNADLAVLSACKTGTGELVTGEGVMGMSRAFLVAGSRAVVVSLWSVESKATEQLMVAFYQHLKEGMEPPEALRRAKLDLLERSEAADGPSRDLQVQPREVKGKNVRHPVYWAPFVLVGT